MKFEEQFPSLVKFVLVAGEKCDILPVSAVEKNCLDKAKVREAINKLTKAIVNYDKFKCEKTIAIMEGQRVDDWLKKELGLND